MTTEQKSAYLEAHMEVQQHMQQVSMQLNKQMVSQLNPNNLHQHLNPVLGGPNLHIPNQYSNAIKVFQIDEPHILLGFTMSLFWYRYPSSIRRHPAV